MAKRGDKDEDERPDPEEEERGEEDESDSSEEDESEEQDESEESEEEDEKAEEEAEEEDDKSEDEGESDESEEEEEPKAAESEEESDADAKKAEGEEDEDLLPAQLGAQRYVYSAFFTSVILGGYVLGRALETIWARTAITDWAVTNVPAITGVPDETKQTYSFIVAGVIAIALGIHYFRKDSVRKWAEEVSGELLKVKWPTRKEVYSSTVVVLATSAVAVTYLFLLDRFWAFVTDKIYGIGS